MPGKTTEPKMGSEGSSKERLKWTQELHNLFEKAVNQLGGPERATPKGILKVMGIPGLTIYHVKSHLQKYRMSKFVPEDPIRGKFEIKSISEILPNFSATSGAQLNEALQIQMNVYKRLSDQHEVQRSLKMKMEAQGRFLERIMEEHRMKASCSSKPISKSSYSPIMSSLPSLCEDSESNVKDMESDSEVVDRNETMRSNEEVFPQRKRIRFDDNEAMSQSYSFASESLNNNLLPFSGMEMNNFPWSFMSYQSPMLPAAMYDSRLFE
ncbi:PREDICTED: myb family transcription factor PHL7-like [Ipomoea nil]|uniref:myb family transcription factor PHL7-like n=1 Tax=Ipomoea nil TaxID=35883 RepID=UPI000900FD2F|nr:PREDICTED: myb family transcription factor PHL7-like [Ipomoea nil]